MNNQSTQTNNKDDNVVNIGVKAPTKMINGRLMKQYVRYHKGTPETMNKPFTRENRSELFNRVEFVPKDAREVFSDKLKTTTGKREMLELNGFTLLDNVVTSVQKDVLKIPNHVDGASPGEKPSPEEIKFSEHIRDTYFKEVAEQIKNTVDAKYSFFLSYATRFGKKRSAKGEGFLTRYATLAHVDYSETILPKIRGMLLKRGVPQSEIDNLDICLYNVWQPVENNVEQNPLACLDHTSVDEDKDIVRAELGFNFLPRSNKNEERKNPVLCYAKNPEKHKWYYFPRMTPKEAILFKQLDSRTAPNFSKRCFHTSFFDCSDVAPNDPLERLSIETRYICCFPKQSKSKL